jgi:hypothetical protein
LSPKVPDGDVRGTLARVSPPSAKALVASRIPWTRRSPRPPIPHPSIMAPQLRATLCSPRTNGGNGGALAGKYRKRCCGYAGWARSGSHSRMVSWESCLQVEVHVRAPKVCPKGVPQRCAPKVPDGDVRGTLARVSPPSAKGVPQRCAPRVCPKGVPQGCAPKVCPKGVPQRCAPMGQCRRCDLNLLGHCEEFGLRLHSMSAPCQTLHEGVSRLSRHCSCCEALRCSRRS